MLLLLRRVAGDRRRLIPSPMLPWSSSSSSSSSFPSFSSSSRSCSFSEILEEPEAVIIALGGNMGDVPAAMASALARLPYRSGSSSSSRNEPTSFVLATSRLFASQPAYVTQQPPFFNAAAAVVTRLPPLRLLRVLKGLERDAGRRGKGEDGEPAVRFGPRPLDLDVVFYGGLRGTFFENERGSEEKNDDDDDDDDDARNDDAGNEEDDDDDLAVAAAVAQGLELPHPRWSERAFVMAPACDLVGGVEAAEESAEESEESRRFGSGLRLFGFAARDEERQRQQQSHRRRSLRPPGLPFPLPSRASAEAVSRSLCEAALRWRELCLSSSSLSPEADCRLGGEGRGASQCWPVLPLPHGFGGWRAQARTPRVMAVLNVTPDSFSDGGRLMKKKAKEAATTAEGFSNCDIEDDPPPDIPAVLAAAHLAVSRGADLLDVGGQSTRPGAQRVSEEVEARRVVPVVRALAGDEMLKRLKIPISVDTFYASVAEQALEAGAHIINDVTGGKGDAVEGKMAAAVASGRGALILTHNRGKGGGGNVKGDSPSSPPSFDPSGGSADSDYGDVAVGVAEELAGAAESAVMGAKAEKAAGNDDDDKGDDDSLLLLLPWSLALDPGLGFSKTREQNLSLLSRTEDIREALPPQFRTMPVLVGASRKGFLLKRDDDVAGPAQAEEEEEEGGATKPPLHPRDPATFASSAVAAAHGADLLRVHEVARNKEAAGMGASVRWARAEEGGGSLSA